MNEGRIVRRYGVLLTGALLGKAIALVSAAMLGRYLGSAGFGVYGTAITILGFVLIGANAGLDSIGTREVVKKPDRMAPLIYKVRKIRLAVAILVGALSFGLVWALKGPMDIATPLVLAGLTLALREDWVLIALGADRAVVQASLVREGVYLLLVTTVVASTRSVAAAAWSYLAADFTWAVLTRTLARWQRRTSGDGTAPGALTLLRQGWPIAFMGFMSITYNKIDTPLLAWLRGPSEAGAYYAAYTVVFGALALIAPFTRVVLPEMVRTSAAGSGGALRAAVRLCLLGAVVGAGLSIVIVSVPAWILGRLYGPTFLAGAGALGVLGWLLVFNFPSSILLQKLVADGRQNTLAVAGATAAAVNLGMNLLLIPKMGMQGAAFATIGSEFTLLLVPVVAYARDRAIAQFIRNMAWIAGAAALAWLVARGVPDGIPLLAPLVAIAFYCVLILPMARSLRHLQPITP